MNVLSITSVRVKHSREFFFQRAHSLAIILAVYTLRKYPCFNISQNVRFYSLNFHYHPSLRHLITGPKKKKIRRWIFRWHFYQYGMQPWIFTMHTIEWLRRVQCTVECAARKSDRIFKRLSDLYAKYPPAKEREGGTLPVQYRGFATRPISVENGMD